MTSLYASTVIARIHWGFSIRAFPGSGPQHSYVVPPPTTVIGALAYSSGMGSEYYVKDEELYSSAAQFVEEYWPFYVVTSLLDTEIPLPKSLQMIKYFSAPYRAYADIGGIFSRMIVSELRSPISIGYVVAPCWEIAVIFLSKKPLRRQALWSLSRLGSKESLVSASNVHTLSIEVKKVKAGDEVENINTYVLADLIEMYKSRGAVYSEPLPFPLTKDEWITYYSLRRKGTSPIRNTLIPHPTIDAAVLAKDALLAEIPYNGVKFRILIPIQVLGDNL